MSAPSSAGPSRRRVRQSIAHVPSANMLAVGNKENMTTDLSAFKTQTLVSKKTNTKKSRSKSLGPGGLDALNDTTGNISKAIAATPIIKSILKPTIPISPPKAIPSFDETRKRALFPTRNPLKRNSSGNTLIDFSPSAPAPVVGGDLLVNPFGESNSFAHGLAQQAAQKEKAEREKREAERKAILEQRASRRKSMANRRVSFAPEATLHTWNVVEIPDDSTTSSASTNSTRRASNINAHSPAPKSATQSDLSDTPSTPPEQVEDAEPESSPDDEHDLHQKKRRRISGIPPMNFNNPDDLESSSPFSGSSVADSDDTNSHTVLDDDEGVTSSSDDEDEGTMMSLDGGNATATNMSMASIDSESSGTSSSARLDLALRNAVNQAGKQDLDYDDDEQSDMSMEVADDEITNAFQPWVKKSFLRHNLAEDMTSRQDQENAEPFFAKQRTAAHEPQVSYPQLPVAGLDDDENEDMSMDVTKAIGGILQAHRAGASSLQPVSSKIQDEPLDETATESEGEDMSMDVTKAIGRGILKAKPEVRIQSPVKEPKSRPASGRRVRRQTGFHPSPSKMPQSSDTEHDEEEEMSMDVTKAVGRGIISAPGEGKTPSPTKSRSISASPVRQSPNKLNIPQFNSPAKSAPTLEAVEEVTEELSMNEEMTMEVTKAIGGILQTHRLGGIVREPETPHREVTPSIDVQQEAEEEAEQPEKTTLLQDILSMAASRDSGPESPKKQLPEPSSLEASRQSEDLFRSSQLHAPPSILESLDAIRKPLSELRSPSALFNPAQSPSRSPARSPAISKSPLRFVVKSPSASTRKRKSVFVAEELKARIMEGERSAQEGSFDSAPGAGSGSEEERIYLQDFLKMTNIQFMELTTTKRRHTIAPRSGDEQTPSFEDASGDTDQVATLEERIVAASSTVPMLELFQHSCRELKSYISEGRRVIQSIEQETYEENPPLFKEYMSAPPDVRSLMDNQFRNVKTHARLMSKAMWYEWRMKLLDGLKDGLHRLGQEMSVDDRALSQQEKLLEANLQGFVETQASLDAEDQLLAQRVKELDETDQDELKEARGTLSSVEEKLEERQALLAQLQQQLKDHEDTISAVAELKNEFNDQIAEAERVRESCRGWSVEEVNSHRAKVERLERETGWKVRSAENSDTEAVHTWGPALTMRYREQLSLFFYPGAFQPLTTGESLVNAPISLQFSPDLVNGEPVELTNEVRFFVQALQSQLHGLQQASTSARDCLHLVSNSWDMAMKIQHEIEHLHRHIGITEVSIVNDGRFCVSAKLLLRPSSGGRARLDVSYGVTASLAAQGLDIKVDVQIRKIYGNGLKVSEAEMTRVLQEQVHKKIGALGAGVWARDLRALEDGVARV